MAIWKEQLEVHKGNKKAADSLADPAKYDNLFPGLADSLKGELYLEKTRKVLPASQYPFSVVSYNIIFK